MVLPISSTIARGIPILLRQMLMAMGGVMHVDRYRLAAVEVLTILNRRQRY